jgi:hypothetical protein
MQRDVRNEKKKTENSLLAPDDWRQVFSETLQPVATDGAEFARICARQAAAQALAAGDPGIHQ